MKLRAKTVSALIVGLLCFSKTNAQTFTSAGTFELGGNILFSNQKDNKDEVLNTFIFNPYIGAMLGKGFEISLIPSYVSLTEDNDTRSLMAILLAPAINFPSGNSYPYFEFLVGYNIQDIDAIKKGVAWGVETGAKFNVTPNGLMILQLQFLSQNFKEKSERTYTAYNTLSLGIGFRVFIAQKTETAK